MTAGLSSAADREISRLLEENRQLLQDLRQAQTDKDFVWGLWKKLQVSNPDVTEAISHVVQRERDKAEQRDRKVLEILQQKDERIEELQANLAYNTRELGENVIRSADVNEEVAQLQRHVDTLQDRNSTLELQLRNIEGREKNLENVHSETIQGSEREKRDLSKKLVSLQGELDKARSEKADEMALRVQMESKVRTLDREVQQKLGKFEELVNELEEARTLLRRFESQVRQQQQDLDYKNQELETVRKELAELWTTHNQLTEHSSQQADLIRQIQSLQTDTQKMLKNQEEAYCLESNSIQQMYTDLTSRYDIAKKAESELRSQVLGLKKELLDREDTIAELKHKADRARCKNRDDNSGSFIENEQIEPVLDLEYKCKSMQKEIDNLRHQLKEKNGHIEQLEDDAINQTIEFDVARLNRHERTHSTPARRNMATSPVRVTKETVARQKAEHRSRSMSPRRREMQCKPRYHIQKELEDCRAILKLKVRELTELKKAHAKRLERLKSVQDNYRNVKEQLKTLEAEYYGSKKKVKPKRADPKDLRHEDSAAVWNELAYFKNENRNLVVERMALEEELDNLRVQGSQDAATLHELKVALDQEREERQYDRKKAERDKEGVSTQKSELVLLKSEVQNKESLIERLDRELGDVKADKDVLTEEKRLLKQDINDLKQEASQHRMDQADLKRDIQRLRRELEEERTLSKLNASRAAGANTKKQSVKPKRKSSRGKINLNSSANTKFEEVVEEGWEELSESDNDDSETGTDTLGRHIVMKSQSRTTSTTDDNLAYRVRRAMQMKQSGRARRAATRHTERMQSHTPKHTEARAQKALAALYRDMGTSPIHDPPVSPTPATQRKSPAHTAALRQLRPMKQRVAYLQQQVITLRDSRAVALKTVNELKENNTQIQTDLNHAQNRLRVSKQSIQKLNNDLDKLHQERKELENKLTQKMENIPSESGHSDHDWKVQESRLKNCSNELSRQNNVVRQLKQENEQLTDQVKLLQDKLSRAERDSNQKRTLLEDQRSRVKQALETARADAESLEQLETRTKLLQDTNEKQKIQLDSYKKRLGAVTREKREYEERFLKLTNEVDKKNKLLLDSQSRKQELESSLTDMERLATQQMKCLARESEGALDTAKDKLREVHDILQAYQRFVKSLAQEIVRRTHQSRCSLKEYEHRKVSVDKSQTSMQRAQDLAKDILNLSQSDLDDIMSVDSEHAKLETELETEKRRDKKWSKRVERVQMGKDDFAMALLDLFIQKMEERVELTAKLGAMKSGPMESSTQTC